MSCQSCGKRLTRKTARTDGKRMLCSTCLFGSGYPQALPDDNAEIKIGHST